MTTLRLGSTPLVDAAGTLRYAKLVWRRQPDVARDILRCFEGRGWTDEELDHVLSGRAPCREEGDIVVIELPDPPVAAAGSPT